jgi:hypothetical protein
VPEPKQGKNRMHLDLWVADIEVEARSAGVKSCTYPASV